MDISRVDVSGCGFHRQKCEWEPCRFVVPITLQTGAGCHGLVFSVLLVPVLDNSGHGVTPAYLGGFSTS